MVSSTNSLIPQLARGWDYDKNNNHESLCPSQMLKWHDEPQKSKQGKHLAQHHHAHPHKIVVHLCHGVGIHQQQGKSMDEMERR